MGPRQGVGKVMGPRERARTGVRPGGVHGGSAELVELAGVGVRDTAWRPYIGELGVQTRGLSLEAMGGRGAGGVPGGQHGQEPARTK
jgi:hypothetical protein